MIRKFLLFCIFIILNLHVFSQDTIKQLYYFEPIDYPYIRHSIDLYNYQYLLSPSMSQSLKTTESFYNFVYYWHSKINWNKLFKHKLLAYLANLSSYFAIEIGLTYLPFGDSWLHEEYHRSLLTYYGIASHDQVYDFPLFSQLISVNNVTDRALIDFKRKHPQDFVRISEAGIEGEYMLIKQLQKRSIFLNQNIPYWLSELNITLNVISYVFMCHTDQAINITNESNQHEPEIKDRDFIGLDFTAWAYDLFNPDTPYTARGLHPYGNGIDRYIKPNDLDPEAYYFLKRQGYLQFINLASPFLIGINEIKLNNNINFNFALHHYLTSFGYTINNQIFIKSRDNFLFDFYLFRNKNLWLPGFGLEIYKHKIKNNFITYKTFLAFEPSNLRYFDQSFIPAAQLSLQFEHFYHSFGFYIGLDFKSKGWVPGELCQSDCANLNLGFVFKK